MTSPWQHHMNISSYGVAMVKSCDRCQWHTCASASDRSRPGRGCMYSWVGNCASSEDFPSGHSIRLLLLWNRYLCCGDKNIIHTTSDFSEKIPSRRLSGRHLILRRRSTPSQLQATHEQPHQYVTTHNQNEIHRCSVQPYQCTPHHMLAQVIASNNLTRSADQLSELSIMVATKLTGL